MDTIRTLRVAVSGIPRGCQTARPDGNWLSPVQRTQIESVSSRIELIEHPADRIGAPVGSEVLLAEGGNRTHYPGELDWDDYLRFFMPSLRWVQLCSTGFSDNITPQVLDGSVTLTNAPGIHTIPIAESVLAAMLDHAKRLRERRIHQQSRDWQALHTGELHGRTVLIIGLGRIGGRVAQLARAFGMRVIGVRRTTAAANEADEVIGPPALRARLPEADYVVMTAPLTPETERMLGAAELAAMKPSAYFVNVGRGSTVDEDALARAMATRQIAGAYLDAFADEPLPPAHPFWALDNVLLVPHDSHSSPHITDRMVALFCDNLRRYVGGEPLLHVCDRTRGY
ncbi:MAG: D-2-hydroxyacid dehydrogenase [Chloroflexi bacterium]|nr:D-2-hydroxyacid dehydrogenase [Chloroflexota bacterium]